MSKQNALKVVEEWLGDLPDDAQVSYDASRGFNATLVSEDEYEDFELNGTATITIRVNGGAKNNIVQPNHRRSDDPEPTT